MGLLKDRVRSSVTLELVGVELLLLHVERRSKKVAPVSDATWKVFRVCFVGAEATSKT